MRVGTDVAGGGAGGVGRLTFSSEPMKGGGRSTGTSIVSGNDVIFSLKSSLYVRAKGKGSILSGGGCGRFDLAASDLSGEHPAARFRGVEDEGTLRALVWCFNGVRLSSSTPASAFEGCSFRTARKSNLR